MQCTQSEWRCRSGRGRLPGRSRLLLEMNCKASSRYIREHLVLFSLTQSPQSQTAESGPWHLKHTRRVRRHLHMISTSNYEKCTCIDLPYRKATEVLCNRVAAQVQDETTALATRPDLTVRPAVENISEVCNSLLYRLRTQVVTICARLAMTFNHVSFGRDRSSTYHTKRK